MARLKLIEVAGNAFERGYMHGRSIAAKIRGFIDDGLCRLNYLVDSPLETCKLSSVIEAHKSVVQSNLPEIAEEIEGFARGAEIPSQHAWLLQLRREVIGYTKITGGDCTTFASAGEEPFLAQTIDLNGNLDDFINLLKVKGPKYRSLILSFAGLLGYLGINEEGLAIGLNLVLGGKWAPGVPPYLMIRHLLDTHRDVDSALEELKNFSLSSSRSFTLCDMEQAVCVEFLDNEMSILDSPTPIHTNHFLNNDFCDRDELNIFAKNSSKIRLTAAEPVLEDSFNPDNCFDLLSVEPICVKDIGDIRRERTVSAVVMRPRQGRIDIRPGDPSISSTQTYYID